MPSCGATTDENVRAALRAAIGRLSRDPEIAAGDSGSHLQSGFQVSNESKLEAARLSKKGSRKLETVRTHGTHFAMYGEIRRICATLSLLNSNARR